MRGEVPEQLKGKKIFSLDISSMLAGSKAQGDFQVRLKALIKEVADSTAKSSSMSTRSIR